MADEAGTSSARATTSRRPSSRDFEVFLNFGGSKIRDTVVDFIYDALFFGEGVRVFYVDESIRQEEVTEGEIMEVIANSKIYIPIFSKDYASSRWCLRELKLIMECWEASQKQGNKKTILPIFYDVDVSIDVKLKSEVYTTALQKHKDELGVDMVKPWEIALQEATKIKGLDINSHGLAGLTRLLVEKVRCELQARSDPEKVPNDYVGMDNPIEGIMTTLKCPSRDFEVLLSFRGPDTRHTVGDDLYRELNRAGFRVFYDDEDTRPEEVIGGEMMEAITNSRIYIPIFSRNYASSRWCLRELGKIVDMWEASQELEEKKTILPIFYDVDFRDVGLKTRVYTTALQEHKNVLGEDVVKPWEMALQKVAKIKGWEWDICNPRLNELVKLIVEEVRGELWTTSGSDPGKFVESDLPSEEYDEISSDVMDTSERLPQAANVLAPSFSDKYAWGGTHKKLKKAVHKDEQESSSAEATTSGRTSRWVHNYDVFINFRGPDGRHTIVDVLHHALVQAGIRVFIDDEEIRRGEMIEGELEKAIINSNIYIPIFSKDYASSRWCLRELELIMKCWEASQKQEEKKTILPIFYDVDVSDLKLRSGVYTTALQKHKNTLGKDVVKPWEIALQEVAKVKGWNLRDHSLAELAELIVEEVFRKLWEISDQDMVPDDYVGMDDPMKDFIKLIDLDSHDVRFVAIHGIGGVGKTTLARLVFHKISSNFRHCAFLSNVREKSYTADGIVNLQKDLISQLLKVNPPNFSYTDQGVNAIKKLVNDKRVLIVLDDLDQSDQLSKLAAHPSWFGMRSRIIVTTRDIGIMARSEDFYQYKMQEMKFDDALKLFSRQVFNSDSLPEEYHIISRKVVDTTNGHPLAITVIASLCKYKSIDAWEDILMKLKEKVHMDVKEKLMISYDKLDYHQKEIFLDIACLFINKEIEDAIYYWEARHLYPRSGIMILRNMSLIEIIDGNRLQMYALLGELGRNLVNSESEDPKKRSRLWSPDKALRLVCSEEGSKKAIALKLGKPDAPRKFNHKQFAGFEELMFLEFNGGNFENEDFEKVFSELRWLSWNNCPADFGATNLCFKNLIVLMLSEGPITDDWGGWREIKTAEKLKVLKCTNCQRLTKSPDFSSFPQLERLVFGFCGMLRDVDRSIGKLEHLTYLEFTSLFNIETLPDSIGGLKSLCVLKLKHVNLLKLPASIEELQNLEYLCLWCPKLKELPESVGNLKLLAHLDISYTAITKLPQSVSNLESLKVFKCDDSPLKVVPDNIKRLIPSPQFDPSSIEGTEILKDK